MHKHYCICTDGNVTEIELLVGQVKMYINGVTSESLNRQQMWLEVPVIYAWKHMFLERCMHRIWRMPECKWKPIHIMGNNI